MRRKLKVGILFGGQSGEHDVSLVSAQAIMAELAANDRFEVIPIGISRSGRWILHPDALPMLAHQSALEMGEKKPDFPGNAEELRDESAALVPSGGDRALIRIGAGAGTGKDPGADRQPGDTIDVIFPVLHGPRGEDGTVQGFLELAGIPYVGAGVAASAACMDKDLMKRVLRDAGLRVADWVMIRRSDWRSGRADSLRQAEKFGYPSFVKPANMGSSVGITRATNRDELAAGLDEAARYDRRIIVEEAIDAREIECSVLGNDDAQASVPGEIVPAGDFYDFASKYVDDQSELHIPADLSPGKSEEIRELSIRSFTALDCAGMARVDFLVERKSGEVFVNELNTIPGFTPISMYTKLWEASGLPYGELIERLIDLAFERHRDRADIETVFDIPGAGD